jgi:hypothetical protein
MHILRKQYNVTPQRGSMWCTFTAKPKGYKGKDLFDWLFIFNGFLIYSSKCRSKVHEIIMEKDMFNCPYKFFFFFFFFLLTIIDAQ